jgi:hypothetical protein
MCHGLSIATFALYEVLNKCSFTHVRVLTCLLYIVLLWPSAMCHFRGTRYHM